MCKNYNLKNLHTKYYINTRYNITYKLILIIFLFNLVYIGNNNVTKQYVISLYKTDKRIISNMITLFVNYMNFIYQTLFNRKYIITD